ncbi:MAG: leucine-rich repeat domain-containing protein [Candidatus Fimenecus sp.]
MENIKLKVNRTLKSLIAILLAFIMAFSILPMLIYAANGDRGLFGDFKYEIIDESLKTIKIIEYNGNARDLTIPQTIIGYEVIEIGIGAFNGCKSLTTVKFPKSLKKIESKFDHTCFGGCENLRSIEFQDGIEEIGECAFQYCSSLLSINRFPKSLKTIGNYAFANTALKELKFDGFIERINPFVFSNCNIRSLSLPEGTKYISEGHSAVVNI